MKPEYIFLTVATVAAVVWYAVFDKYQPDHSEFGADITRYSIDGVEVDPEMFEADDEDL